MRLGNFTPRKIATLRGKLPFYSSGFTTAETSRNKLVNQFALNFLTRVQIPASPLPKQIPLNAGFSFFCAVEMQQANCFACVGS